LRRIALANVALHLVGLALGATLMRPGSIEAPLAERQAYIAEHALEWRIGWGVWMAAAVTYVLFMRSLGRSDTRTWFAVLIAFAAATFDLVGDAIQMSLPHFAGGPRFVEFERLANFIGLVLAFGLYSLAVLVATWKLSGHVIAALGSITFVAGLVMVVGGLADEPSLVVLSAGPTILAYCGWVLAVAFREPE
jgi:hypothetical protein